MATLASQVTKFAEATSTKIDSLSSTVMKQHQDTNSKLEKVEQRTMHLELQQQQLALPKRTDDALMMDARSFVQLHLMMQGQAGQAGGLGLLGGGHANSILGTASTQPNPAAAGAIGASINRRIPMPPVHEPPPQPPAIPAGWEMVWTPQGRSFYYNITSGASQWELPAPVPLPVPV